MIKDLIKLADSLDAAGHSKSANTIDIMIKKVSMYLGDGYAICDGKDCSARFPLESGTRTPDGSDLCPVCSGTKPKEQYESEISETRKPHSFTKRYRHYGDIF